MLTAIILFSNKIMTMMMAVADVVDAAICYLIYAGLR